VRSNFLLGHFSQQRELPEGCETVEDAADTELEKYSIDPLSMAG